VLGFRRKANDYDLLVQTPISAAHHYCDNTIRLCFTATRARAYAALHGNRIRISLRSAVAQITDPKHRGRGHDSKRNHS
jgi:hypothetical protein